MTSADEHLADLTVAELARRVAEEEVSAVEVVEACLARIGERDPALNAFSVVLADQARAEAAARDQALAEGATPGPLHGVPVAIKEEIDVAGCVTTFGGRANSTPVAVDGEVVRRLRAAGAVIIGKTRMPEFGAWPYTESVDGGYTRNPWKPGHTPGGSSGGTAVAVAAGMVPVGLGGDGGGSIRIPSACCGLFGLKPQRGRVTTAPMEHLWWALGTVGPLARSVLDSAIVYDVIRGNTATDLLPGTRAADELHRGSPHRVPSTADRVVHEVADQGSASRHVPRAGGRGDGAAAHRPRPRGRGGRPPLSRRDPGLRAAVLRRRPRPRATRCSTTTAWRGAPARPIGSAAGCGPVSSGGR